MSGRGVPSIEGSLAGELGLGQSFVFNKKRVQPGSSSGVGSTSAALADLQPQLNKVDHQTRTRAEPAGHVHGILLILAFDHVLEREIVWGLHKEEPSKASKLSIVFLRMKPHRTHRFSSLSQASFLCSWPPLPQVSLQPAWTPPQNQEGRPSHPNR